jgi:hypothetical protein
MQQTISFGVSQTKCDYFCNSILVIAINIVIKYSRCDITKQYIAPSFTVPAVQNDLIFIDKNVGYSRLAR